MSFALLRRSGLGGLLAIVFRSPHFPARRNLRAQSLESRRACASPQSPRRVEVADKNWQLGFQIASQLTFLVIDRALCRRPYVTHCDRQPPALTVFRSIRNVFLPLMRRHRAAPSRLIPLGGRGGPPARPLGVHMTRRRAAPSRLILRGRGGTGTTLEVLMIRARVCTARGLQCCQRTIAWGLETLSRRYLTDF